MTTSATITYGPFEITVSGIVRRAQPGVGIMGPYVEDVEMTELRCGGRDFLAFLGDPNRLTILGQLIFTLDEDEVRDAILDAAG